MYTLVYFFARVESCHMTVTDLNITILLEIEVKDHDHEETDEKGTIYTLVILFHICNLYFGCYKL